MRLLRLLAAAVLLAAVGCCAAVIVPHDPYEVLEAGVVAEAADAQADWPVDDTEAGASASASNLGAGRKLADLPSHVLAVPLTRSGNHFTTSLKIGSHAPIKGIVVDTGSFDCEVLRSAIDATKVNTSSVQSSQTLSEFDLLIDGVELQFFDSRLVLDRVSFAGAPNSPRPRALYLNPASWASRDSSPRIHLLSNITGFMGIGPQPRTVSQGYNGTFGALLGAWVSSRPHARYMIGLDLSSNGTMYLGGLPPAHAAHMQWAPIGPAFVPRSDGYVFSAFHMSVCGVDMFGNYSSHWMVLLDSGSTCLQLPPTVWESLMAWLPVDCSHMVNSRCVLAPGVSPSDLPHLVFRMQENGQPLAVPLADLVVNTDTVPTLCVIQGRFDVDYATQQHKMSMTSIVFGSLVLRSLFTAIDWDRSRVGFANKVAFDQGSFQQCSKPPVCKGAQTYYARLNLCISPPCDDYQFQSLNAETQMCEISTGFIVVGVSLVVMFILAELYLHVGTWRIGAVLSRRRQQQPRQKRRIGAGWFSRAE